MDIYTQPPEPYMVRCMACEAELDYDDPGNWPKPPELRDDGYPACPRCCGQLVSLDELGNDD